MSAPVRMSVLRPATSGRTLPGVVVALLVGALLGPGSGCKGADKDDAAKSKRPQVKVNLPPSPEMTEKRFAAKYTDGSYRVEGLIADRRKVLNKHVTVKGFIKEVHRCPEDGEVCDPPEHAVLVDDLARPGRRLLVVGGEKSRFNTLEQGMKDTFEGYYQTSDPNGLFVRMEGILVLKKLAVAAPEPGEPPTKDSPPSGDGDTPPE